MAQPYDLSGIATAQTTVAQMLKDQRSGAVKFAGGFQTWQPSPSGAFKAILTVGGSLQVTTTNAVRINLKVVRAILDLLAGGTGSVAANVVKANTPPSLLLEAGQLPTGPTTATGAVMNAPVNIANTNYDLSGIAALQTTVYQMLTDQQAGTTVFVGNAKFSAMLTSGGAAQSTTLPAVVALFAALTANFDLLDQ